MIDEKQQSGSRVIVDRAAQAVQDIANADESRAAALQSLQGVATARAGAMGRERARLIATAGETDPRVAALDEKIAATKGFVAGVSVSTDRSRMAIPAVDADGWAVYGYVRDASLTGQPKLTVAMYDASGTWLTNLGYTCTDDTGYFSLVVPGRAADPNNAPNLPASAVLHVLSAGGGGDVYIDKMPSAIVVGAAVFREITLGVSASACPPPGGSQSPENSRLR